VVSSSADGEMLGKLRDDVLSRVFSRGELEQEFPRIRGMLHDAVMRDRAISWRTTPDRCSKSLRARCRASIGVAVYL